jgi:preprotein translocase subunit SecY
MVRSIQIVMAPGSVLYEVLYFVFIFAFTFFSIVVYFQPKDFAEDLKKSGTYIPGIRPGAPTAQYLWRLLVRLSFLGGLYLAVVAILPMIAQKSTGITTLSLGGTGLLIVVSVVLEIAQTMQSQLIHDQYEKYA